MKTQSSISGRRFGGCLELAIVVIFVFIANQIIIDFIYTSDVSAQSITPKHQTSLLDRKDTNWYQWPVIWVNLINATVNGNNTLSKTNVTGWGNSGAASLQYIPADGGVEFKAMETNTSRICGLSGTDIDTNYTSIEYGILLNYTGNNTSNATVYESGINRGGFGNYTSGDVFGIERRNGIIKYLWNRIVFYASPITSSGPLLVDVALNTTNSTIANCYMMGPNDPPVAMNQSVAAIENTPLNITLSATDPQQSILTYEIVTNPVNGSLSGTAPNLTYASFSGFNGKDSFTFRAYDGKHYSNVAQVSIFVWTQPLRLDSTYGTEPTPTYSPNGDLRVFYNIEPTYPNNYMVVRTRLNQATSFDPEIFVYNSARTLAIHYDLSGKLDLAVDTGYYVKVLESLDNGNSWNLIKSYPGLASPALSAALGIELTEDNSDLRLFYNYMQHDGVFGSYPSIYYAQRKNGIWDNNGLLLSAYDDIIGGSYENGNKVSVFAIKGIHHSTDNGANFNLMTGGPGLPDILLADDVAVDQNGRVYFIRSMTGLLILRYSDDNCSNWSPTQYIIQDPKDKFSRPRISIDGNKMLVIWLDTAPSTYKYNLLKCIVSEDGGNTWSDIMTIVSVGPAKQIEVAAPRFGFTRPHEMDNYAGVFSVTYSLCDSVGSRDSVEIIELNLQ